MDDGGGDLIKHTNLSSYMMQLCYLSESGFGTIKELKELDSPEFLDLLEYKQIRNAIEAHKMREARNGADSN